MNLDANVLHLLKCNGWLLLLLHTAEWRLPGDHNPMQEYIIRAVIIATAVVRPISGYIMGEWAGVDLQAQPRLWGSVETTTRLTTETNFTYFSLPLLEFRWLVVKALDRQSDRVLYCLDVTQLALGLPRIAIARRTKSCGIYLSFVGYFSLDLCLLRPFKMAYWASYSSTFFNLK